MARNWMRLDNAALIFPAVRRSDWSNAFRMTATLDEAVDPAVLQQAVADLMPRFPSLFVRLRAGAFWYYLEQIKEPPRVRQDYAYPLTHMDSKSLRACCLRVLYYKKRIAVEFFHSLTDGTGGLIFIKTLTARYLERKYGLSIPAEEGVLDWREPPREEELEDSFLRCSGKVALSRAEEDALRLKGTPERTGFLHHVVGLADTKALLTAAHAQHCTVTVFLCAVMCEAILAMQAERTPLRRRKPVKITVPVNLRRLFPSQTLRNFALTVNPGVDARLGDCTLSQLCASIAGQLAADATPQRMAGRIAANVQPQQLTLLKLAPLPVKNAVMRMVYARSGESKGCLNISNLGLVKLPEAMQPYVRRIEFVIGVQRSYPNNCSVVADEQTTCISMIRRIRESELEQRFFARLVELGVPVEIESNGEDERSCTV